MRTWLTAFALPALVAAPHDAALAAPPAAAQAAAAKEMARWLEATPLVDRDAPAVREAARRIVGDAASPRERAVRIHDFVRDEIRFGWTRGFYRLRASEVLEAGVGYCNTKSTLFVALLRAAGIPARQHFVQISREILYGLVERPGPFVDHSFSEVFLDGVWVRVDSYVVDRPLEEAARARLQREGRRLGYGLHLGGTTHWDGRSDAFSQLADDGSVADLVGRDYGVHRDTKALYDAGFGDDRLTGLQGWLIPLFIGRADDRVVSLRGAGSASAP